MPPSPHPDFLVGLVVGGRVPAFRPVNASAGIGAAAYSSPQALRARFSTPAALARARSAPSRSTPFT